MEDKIQGAIIEHWIDRRIRLKRPTIMPGNFIRIPAESALKLNDLRNRLLGTKTSLLEASERIENKIKFDIPD